MNNPEETDQDDRFSESRAFGFWTNLVLVLLLPVQIAFMNTFIVPNFMDAFSSMGGELPVITEFLLKFVKVLTRYPLLYLPMLVLLLPLILLRRSRSGQYVFCVCLILANSIVPALYTIGMVFPLP